MPDGVGLFTVVWDPRIDSTERIPTIFVRSPYGPEGSQNIADTYIPFGFAIVMQNMRATGESGGSFMYFSQSYSDGHATMEWISTQPWFNGDIFQVGFSADGILCTLDMMGPQPYLHGQFLGPTTALPYPVLFQNHMGWRQSLSPWLALMQQWRPNLPPNTYLNFLMAHEGYLATDPELHLRWTNITLTNWTNIDFPAVWWLGWYDLFLQPNFDSFLGYDEKSRAVGKMQIIIEPRGHCLSEDVVIFPFDELMLLWAWEASLSVFWSQSSTTPPPYVRLPQKNSVLKKYTLYVMGPTASLREPGAVIPGMYITSVDRLPPTTPFTLYFASPGKLSQTAPSTEFPITYTYDPKSPVPSMGGNELPFIDKCGPMDQRPIENRTDTILFTSDVLREDLAVLGQMKVSLTVSTDRNDTDFVVRVTDVYPSGVSMLITDNMVRMRWRNGPDYHAQTVPGKKYTLNIEMWMTCYVFAQGHRIRLAVTSSNTPRYSVNPNNGLDVHLGGPVHIAQNTIFGGRNSRIVFPVVDLKDLPVVSPL
jgi:putative CocE/NonD family hydrolase